MVPTSSLLDPRWGSEVTEGQPGASIRGSVQACHQGQVETMARSVLQGCCSATNQDAVEAL